jgi:hypothetical protein
MPPHFQQHSRNFKLRERLPIRRDEAFSVARELLYRNCQDIVDQGADTVATLAAMMVSGHWWN